MMCLRPFLSIALIFVLCFGVESCKDKKMNVLPINKNKSAAEFLGHSEYRAMSYGGYRTLTRDDQPSISQIKEDLKILSAIGVKVIRTYNLQLDQAPNILKAIRALRSEDASFEMYVMLGLWMECENARQSPNHVVEDIAVNSAEIERAIIYSNQYPDIVKIIAVGNEAMVHWQTDYFVAPSVILKWVNYLQKLKTEDKLPSALWITSSDNFASWGGGGSEYHNEDLESLMKAVDYISVHTYPFHDTHYNPVFWKLEDVNLFDNKLDAIDHAMKKAVDYQYAQFLSVKNYMQSIGIQKDIHIGETGWASIATDLYGDEGTHAADEYKQSIYFDLTTKLCNSLKISCFYFSAFDEPWKDSSNQSGSENHFGLFTVEGKAKYALWSSVDSGLFKGLGRNGIDVQKTYDGNKEDLIKMVQPPLSYISEQ